MDHVKYFVYMSIEYNLDRKSASRLLKVSTRTVDRYVKSKKLSTRVVDGRVWLSKAEVLGLIHERGSGHGVNMSRMDLSIVKSVDTSRDSIDNGLDNIEVLDQSVSEIADQKNKKGSKGNVYKKLYLDLKEELKEKQERLEIANYRVGQLETQIKNSIPMLEYHQEKFLKSQSESDLKNSLDEAAKTVKKLAVELKYEKFNRKIFLIILLILLALQPLWLLFIYN